MNAPPGLARVAATHATNLPRPHPTRKCGVRNAECRVFNSACGIEGRTSNSALRIPHSALISFRTPHLIASTIPSGPPYSPSKPSVPTYAIPSSAGSTTGLTRASAAKSCANRSS